MATLVSEWLDYDGKYFRRLATVTDFDTLDEARARMRSYPRCPEELEEDVTRMVSDIAPLNPVEVWAGIDRFERYRYFYLYN